MNPEFSRPVTIEEVSNAGRIWNLEATAEECALLAQRFRILAVTSLSAKVKVKPSSHSDIVRVSGELTGQVVQACCVSLAPVSQTVHEEFDLKFSPAADVPEAGAELEIDLSQDDPPDPFYDGIIDLGEVCAEFLALGLDPFPRAENAEFSFESTDCDDKPVKKPSPFAVLSDLTQKKV